MKKNIAFKREISQALYKLASSFPVVSITGPRQSGKTTLAKECFAEKKYFNLEDPSIRSYIQNDPKGVITSLKGSGAIFDEVQNYPELLSYLQVFVDENKQNGEFVVTGSYNLALLESISQSLAGRVGNCELLPMSISELINANIKLSLDEYLFNGGMPRIFKESLDPSLIYQNYVHTYLERDVRRIINVKDLSQFQNFLRLCASRIGREFNASNIANEIGVSYHTVQNWLSVLEASYILFRLPPFFENFGKRIIKSPKLYFTDVGLACHLLGIDNIKQIIRDPLKGHLFENLVILDFYKELRNFGKIPRLYFFKDRSQNEVDLIWQNGRQLVPIEIKMGQTFKKEFTKGINYFANITKNDLKGFVIYSGDSEISKEQKINLLNFQKIKLLVCDELD